MSDKKLRFKVAGIHVSGPNAAKTAVVVLGGAQTEPPWQVLKLYPRIAPVGSVFSDERVLDIIRIEQPLAAAFVDCPLSVPPCVACQRPVCPGAWHCEDVGVAYMLAQSEKIRAKYRKKKRVVNPQTQRLWDVLHILDHDTADTEPSYSSNMAPLVVRAKTLQRRLMSLATPVLLQETSVAHAVKSLAVILGLAPTLPRDYRNFEIGRVTREDFCEVAVKHQLLKPFTDFGEREQFVSSIDNFQALVTALVAAAYYAGLCAPTPQHVTADEGWVHVPADTRAAWPTITRSP